MSQNFEDILSEAQRNWMDVEGVLAVAQGKKDQKDCIDVYITGNSKTIKNRIPATFKNYPVVFRESGGPFEPQS